MPVFDVNSSKHRFDQSFGAARIDSQLVGGKDRDSMHKEGDQAGESKQHRAALGRGVEIEIDKPSQNDTKSRGNRQ